MITHLAWDSQFFDLKVGRLHCAGADQLDSLLAAAREDHYQLLYLFSDVAIQPESVSQGFCLDVGGQVTYRKQLEPARPGPLSTTIPAEISRFRGKEPTEALLDLALLSGHLSRFRVDDRLPRGSFERLYQRWLRNNLEDENSSRVYIYGPPQQPEGLLTASWKQDQGSVDLLAVRADVQARGIGSRLLAVIEEEASQQGLGSMLIKTQMVNEAAKRAYIRNAYACIESAFVYHVHL